MLFEKSVSHHYLNVRHQIMHCKLRCGTFAEVSNLCCFAFQDLEQRHNTILQMYGEKAEEAEELRLDLEDVKNMYKTQIDELLQNQK